MPFFFLQAQLCSGVDENAIGTCAELVFAPIDASFADDAPLLPSGFRIIPLDTGVVNTSNSLQSGFSKLSIKSKGKEVDYGYYLVYKCAYVDYLTYGIFLLLKICRMPPVQIERWILLLL